MSHYKFRVTVDSNTRLKNIETILYNFSDRLAYVKEGDGLEVAEHYHFYVVVTEGKYNTLRKRIQEYYKDLGYEQKKSGRLWSFSVMNNFEGKYCKDYVRYMSKDNEIVPVKEFPKEWIEQGMIDAKEFKDNIKNKKKEPGGMFKSIVRNLDEKYEKQTDPVITSSSMIEKITKDVLGIMISQNRKFNTMNIESIVTTYLCMRSEKFKAVMASRICDKILGVRY